MTRILRTICVALALASQIATAQPTPPGMRIPDKAVLAEVEFAGNGQIAIDGKLVRLSGAAQIRGTTNLIVLPQALRGTYRMRVLFDNSGSIHRAWIVPNN